MEINNPKHKSYTINNWKQNGVIYDEFDDLYEIYIKTMECGHCKKEFKNKRDRHLDHCHETGLFRKIICRRCNSHDSYLTYPNGVPSKSEIDKKCYHKNKHKNKDIKNEKRREKYTCRCGVIYTKESKARHERSMKHTDWFMEQLD